VALQLWLLNGSTDQSVLVHQLTAVSLLNAYRYPQVPLEPTICCGEQLAQLRAGFSGKL
jgi:hypothetical protein